MLLLTPLEHPPILLQTRNLLTQTALNRALNLLLNSCLIPRRIRLSIHVDNRILMLYHKVSI